MFKQKSLCSLVAAAFLCMAVLISPAAARADSAGGLTLAVTPSVTSASLGENISFNYVITSTCNTTINSLVLTDDKLGTISLPATSIATGGTLTVSVLHAVVSADYPGPFATNATITGISADNATLSAGATSSVTLNQLVSSLTFTMSVDKAAASIGDNISYTYIVTNTGQTALSGIVLTDSRLGAVAPGSTTLAAGASLTATKIYTVLSTDLPGPLTDNATATATSSTGAAVTATSASVSVKLNQTSSIQVSMTASASTASVGDNVSYSYTITNNGQAALSGIVLTDSRLGKITLATDKLTPGAVLTATKAYTVLSADLPGPLTSSATATATSSTGAAVTATSAGVSVKLNQTSSIQVSMSASVSTASVGNNVSYTYTITNNGQAALSGLALTDSRLGAVALGSTTLATGASLTATKTYTVLSADLPGPLTSSATATAVSPSGAKLTANSITVKIALITENDDDEEDNSDNRTKADYLRDRGIPGKGINHAPGLQKPFNPNSHGGGYESDNRTGDNDGNGKGKGQGNNNGNGKGKNK